MMDHCYCILLLNKRYSIILDNLLFQPLCQKSSHSLLKGSNKLSLLVRGRQHMIFLCQRFPSRLKRREVKREMKKCNKKNKLILKTYLGSSFYQLLMLLTVYMLWQAFAHVEEEENDELVSVKRKKKRKGKTLKKIKKRKISNDSYRPILFLSSLFPNSPNTFIIFKLFKERKTTPTTRTHLNFCHQLHHSIISKPCGFRYFLQNFQSNKKTLLFLKLWCNCYNFFFFFLLLIPLASIEDSGWARHGGRWWEKTKGGNKE